MCVCVLDDIRYGAGLQADTCGTLCLATEKLQSAGAKADAKTVCDEVFAKSLRDQVQASGSNCEQEIDKALKDADDFDLEVQAVTINGDQATARVKGRVGDADRVQEFQFEREGSDWRATSIG